jgi:DNA integrity scanning protein DisA with diadenylate cyclase activity
MTKQQTILAIIITSVLVLGTIGFDSFAMGQSNDSSFQTSNQTNTTENASGSAVKMQIDEALKSLESNDISKALVHMQEADKNSSGQLKTHIEDAIKSLESNDSSGALIHIQLAQQNL